MWSCDNFFLWGGGVVSQRKSTLIVFLILRACVCCMSVFLIYLAHSTRSGYFMYNCAAVLYKSDYSFDNNSVSFRELQANQAYLIS